MGQRAGEQRRIYLLVLNQVSPKFQMETEQQKSTSQPKGENGRDEFILSLVIPCYNEQAVLPKLFERVSTAANAVGCKWEVICVDDGSTDDTWQKIRE